MLALVLPFALAACGGETDGGGTDAGTDSGSVEDAGAATGAACDDPVEGSGCADGLSCIQRLFPTPANSCQLAGDTAVGARCYPSAPSCVAGSMCAQLQGSAYPSCVELCDPDTQTGCADSGDQCLVLQGAVEGTGVCQAAPERTACDPADVDASCGPNQTCYMLSPENACVTAGTAGEFDSCTSARCARPLTCVQLYGGDVSGMRCRRACREDAACGEGQRCQIMLNMELGICVAEDWYPNMQ